MPNREYHIRKTIILVTNNTIFHCPVSHVLVCPRPRGGGIKRYRDPSICLSHGAAVCLDYRHAGCLQLSHRRPPGMCGLWTRPRTDVDPPWFLDPWCRDWRRNDIPPYCHRRGTLSSCQPRDDTLFDVLSFSTTISERVNVVLTWCAVLRGVYRFQILAGVLLVESTSTKSTERPWTQGISCITNVFIVRVNVI